jgi:hypothetical protein
MIPPRFLQALRQICVRLTEPTLNWALTGSFGLALQGVPLKPNDIDLQSDARGAYEIERRLAEFVTRPVRFSATPRIRSHFGELYIEGVRVEIIGDIEKRLPDGRWEPPPDLEKVRHFVQVEELCVPVLSLAYEAQAYEKLGRSERALQLRAYLKR